MRLLATWEQLKFRSEFLRALACFSISGTIIASAVLIGSSIRPEGIGSDSVLERAVGAMCSGDGACYVDIAHAGYGYDIGHFSNVAFFPGFPLATRLASYSFGLGEEVAAVVTSNAFLFVAMWLFTLYCSTSLSRQQALNCLVAFAFFPTTFFFRMAYSESMFAILCILVMIGLRRNWNVIAIAFCAGAACAVRPVGLALLPPVVLFVSDLPRPLMRKLWAYAPTILLGTWGLTSYMCYQLAVFDDPITFARAQTQFKMRPDVGMFDKIVALASAEPIWSVYDSHSPAYWRLEANLTNPLLNLSFANPLILIGFAVCIVIGAWNVWLTRYEILLAVGLLAIPYFTRGFEMCMLSQGRYAALCIPVYIVIGRLLDRANWIITGMVWSAFALYLWLYSMQFAAGYYLI